MTPSQLAEHLRCPECGSDEIHASCEVTMTAVLVDGVLTACKRNGPNGLPLYLTCAKCEAEIGDQLPDTVYGVLWDLMDPYTEGEF